MRPFTGPNEDKMSLWDDLKTHQRDTAGQSIRALFEKSDRARHFSAEADGLLFDYSKTSLDPHARDLLIRLAEAAGVASRREAMFAGEKINETEGRAVLHTALRNLGGRVMVDGRDVMPDVRATHARLADFARDVREGRFRGQGDRKSVV